MKTHNQSHYPTNRIKPTPESQAFKNLLISVGSEVGLGVTFINGLDHVIFYSSDEQYELLNYDIGLNSHQSAMKAKSKSLCASILRDSGVAVVEHVSFQPNNYRQSSDSLKDLVDTFGFPLVVKPDDGSGGMNVRLVDNHIDIINAVTTLAKDNLPVCISKYYVFSIEYRCTVLDGEVVMSYGKKRGRYSFQNNLSLGAKVVDVPEELKVELYELAVRTAKTLKLRFTNIDIVDSSEGLRVLEVNDSVALKRVIVNSVDRKREAKNVYVKAIEKLRGEVDEF